MFKVIKEVARFGYDFTAVMGGAALNGAIEVASMGDSKKEKEIRKGIKGVQDGFTIAQRNLSSFVKSPATALKGYAAKALRCL